MTLIQEGLDLEKLLMKNDPISLFISKEKEYFPSGRQAEIVIVNAPDMTQKKNRNLIEAVVNDFEISR